MLKDNKKTSAKKILETKLTTDSGQIVFLGDLIPYTPPKKAINLCELISFKVPSKKLPWGAVVVRGEDGKMYTLGANSLNLKFQ